MARTKHWLAPICCLLALAAAACGGAGPRSVGTVDDPGPLTDEQLGPGDAAKVDIAMRAIDTGQLDHAVHILEGLRQRYPHNHLIVHELGLAYRIQGRPEKAVELLRPYERHLDEQMAAAYGSALDEAGMSMQALEALERALERFPGSGLLYSEIGTVLGRAGKLEMALEFWERGIEVQPEWPSNYLRAAEIYSHSNATGLTLIYGEVFRNLEPGTKRSAAVAVLMVETLRDSVEIEQGSTGDESKGTINLAPALTITISGPPEDGKNPILAGMPLVNAFELAITAGLFVTLAKDGLSLAGLYEIKKDFLEFWWQPEGMNLYHQVRLFEWLRQIRDAGHLEAYTYWLYGPAFADEFFAWRETHQAELDACIDWIAANPLYEPPYGEMYPSDQTPPTALPPQS